MVSRTVAQQSNGESVQAIIKKHAMKHTAKASTAAVSLCFNVSSLKNIVLQTLV